ncbi:hypothetical protein EDF56_10763 [Novosphingobium sp. PhB165]|nr:hypothetical protein EDF56_10763 [Novosphingobium sp. PhB165]
MLGLIEGLEPQALVTLPHLTGMRRRQVGGDDQGRPLKARSATTCAGFL